MVVKARADSFEEVRRFAEEKLEEFKVAPMLLHNVRINSSIDALPYNIRFCNRNFGIDISFLDAELPTLAEVKLDGNCFVLMNAGLVMSYFCGNTLTLREVLLYAILIFAISIGAPNQPGTLIIGMLIAYQYLGISLLAMCTIIILEVFLGRTVTLITVMGDLAKTVIDAKRQGYYKPRRASQNILREGSDGK